MKLGVFFKIYPDALDNVFLGIYITFSGIQIKIDLTEIEMKNISNKIISKIMATAIWLHMLAVAALYFAMNWAQGVLDASYAKSQFPVDYMTGQTSFSGAAVKGWYQSME